jgi:predicted alpha/beta-fold hydrolase
MSRAPNDFQPLPFLGNPHLQTVLGNWMMGPPLRVPVRRALVALPDGDCLVLHDSVPPGWQPGSRIVLLVHGLGGSHRSGHLQRMARLCLRLGLRVVRIDLRGCGLGLTLARRTYHGGCSDDVRAALAEIHRWSPHSPQVVIGFSLGGNIALKMAGEAPDLVPALEGVAAISPPVDLESCAALLALPRNRIYERHYLRNLVSVVRARRRLVPDLAPIRFPRLLTMRLFDDLYTAPLWDFADALDYYWRASALPVLHRIAVPALLLIARDDPFVTAEPLESLAVPEHLEIQILERGGHLGFLGWDGAGGIRWAENRLASWLSRRTAMAD